VRPARGRPPAPETELSDDDDDYETPDSVPPSLADPLRAP
jgi:hypothetical protein